MNLYRKIPTPCIGVCSTGIGDSVCRGCKRYDYEVIDWIGYDESQKRAIDRRISSLLENIVKAYLTITDVDLLEAQLRAQQIDFRPYREPYCWLYELLRCGAGQVQDPQQFGFSINSSIAGKSLVSIRQVIEQEFYALSAAHFERYIVANQKRAVCVTE